jgi:nucleoside-diphosphate-sugar epimerase
MKVLAIGATGFIGRWVIPLLVDQGHDVAVFHRGDTNPNLTVGAREFLGDRDRLRDSSSELRRFAPDVVIDLILYTELQARQLAKSFRGTGSRIVVISSADVYRNYDGLLGKTKTAPDPVPLSESAPLRETRYPYRGEHPSFIYAHDYEKILVEQVLLNDPDLPATIARLPAVYGPGDRQHRLRGYLQRMMRDTKPIVLEEGQAAWRWSRGYVENVASALALLISDDRSSGRVYNVADEPTLTEGEWVKRIAAVAEWHGDILAVPRAELPDDSRQPYDWRYHLWSDTGSMGQELGYVQPVPFEEALRRAVEWEMSVHE